MRSVDLNQGLIIKLGWVARLDFVCLHPNTLVGIRQRRHHPSIGRASNVPQIDIAVSTAGCNDALIAGVEEDLLDR